MREKLRILFRAAAADPRHYQIVSLALLLAYGLARLQFDTRGPMIGLILATVLVTQWAATKLCQAGAYDPRSALISGLSLCLLLRTNSLWLGGLCAGLTIAGKFTLRWRGKHLFNPTNFAIVAGMLLTRNQVWVSPGQWGSTAFFGFLLLCLGGVVVHRAMRGDVTLAFLGFYLSLVFGRSLWLGEPLAIPLHRLQNGALLLFAFFMISDPKTTPDSRAGRVIFAFLVALGAAYVQFRLFRTNGLLWSLALCSLATPLLDWLLPNRRYQWPKSKIPFQTKIHAPKLVYETVST